MQREVFGRSVSISAERPHSRRAQARLIAQIMQRNARPLDTRAEGCLVLMRRGACGKAWHIGVWFFSHGEGWVLHSVANAGAAVVTRERALPMQGFHIEGFYEWVE